MGDTVHVQSAVEVIASDLAEDFAVCSRIASLISFDIDVLHRDVDVAEVVVFRCLLMVTGAIVVHCPRERSTLSVLPHAELIIQTYLRWVHTAVQSLL